MVGGTTPRTSSKKGTKLEDVVLNCARELLTACEMLGFDSRGYALAGTVAWHRHCVEAMGGNWMAFYKYKLAAWMAVGLNGQKPPPAPPALEKVGDKPETLLGGKAGQWLGMVKRRDFGERWQQILSTMSTVKRAMPRPTPQMLKTAAREAYGKLTRTVKLTEELDWDGAPTGRVVEDEGRDDDAGWGARLADIRDKHRSVIKRVIDEVFVGKRFGWMEMLESFFPSTKANYLATRSKGGAVGHIMNSTLLKGLAKDDQELVRVVLVGRSRSRRVEMDDTALTEKFQVLMERILDEAETEEKKVVLVALAEALKVRVISKGPVYTYTVLKPLQKWLWRTLKNHESGVFKLVGEEISSDYLERQLGRLRPEEEFLSGDYKAATDNLGPWVSEYITQTLGERIEDKRIAKLFTEALTGHLIEDPDRKGVFKRQTWGQLMGSIVSFPVLCIANAAICLGAREASVGRQLTLRTAGIAVNGDDCVFRVTAHGKQAWEQIAAEHGMEPSIGKCFFSREFLNMNSAQFLVRMVQGPSEELKDSVTGRYGLVAVPQINLGLVAGLGRSTSGKLEKVSAANWGTLNSISQNATLS